MMEKPDLILLDLYMPETNGLKVCADLKSFHPTDKIPILVYTSCKDDKVINRASLVGASAILSKEISDEELLKNIEKYFKPEYRVNDQSGN